MHLEKRKNLLLWFTLLHFLGYYIWLYYWSGNDAIKTLGGNMFSILAPLVSAFTLLYVFSQTKGKDKYFWLLCSLGCFSYVMAEAIWSYYENFLLVDVPFPGWPDLFYCLQIIFYLLAFLHKLWYKRDHLHLIKFIFDTCIIMTVAIAFSWHFIIQDILTQDHVSKLSLLVSVGYPMGDIILLLCAISFYLGSEYFFSPKSLYLIFLSLIIQVFADSAYLYLTAKDLYVSGGVFDPLWSLSLLLIGVSGLYEGKSTNDKEFEGILNKSKSHGFKDFFSLRLLLPYISVILLFIVMIFQRKEINSLILGSAIAILLVVLRQIFTLIENQTLIMNYHGLTEELEQKIEERTEEIGKKNHQLLEAIKKMKHMAYHDVLSGLPNRRLFLEQLTTAMVDAKINSYKLAILFIDLDRFKNINDTLGHDFGDLLLKFVSKEMSERLRSIDMVSRQGGDEFTILLNEVSHESEVLSLIDQLQSIVSRPIIIKEQELHVSMSIGVALYPTDGVSAEELLKHADMAMYKAKESGRNNYKFFSTDMNETISRKMTLEKGLRKAITNDEFVLHYQPQVSLVTGKIIGMETLIRWNTKDAGMISPGEFIPLAEETRLIIPIGEWVLYTACKQAKLWHDDGYTHLKLAVNLSPLQFLHENLVNVIANVLERTQFNPQSLEIEITEGVSVYDAEEAIMKMQAIRDLGVQISIDDFGTGYSSLIYLKRFPINSLKIAQPFIEDILYNKSDKALVQAIISMAHSLGLSVIAEGVETREQLQSLIELNCDEVQGYFYSKPLPAEQFGELLISDLIDSCELVFQ